MATEEQPVEQPVAAPEAGVEETPAAAAPRKRVKAPQRPDDAEHKAKVDALHESISASKKRGEEIKALMAAHREGQGKGSDELRAVKTKLAELRSAFTAILERRRAAREQLEAVTKARDAARVSLKETRAGLRFTTVEAIDAQIAELEHRLAHGSLSLAEEKRVMGDIRSLGRSKTAVAELTAGMEKLEVDDTQRSDVQARIRTLGEELDAVKAEEEEWKGKLQALHQESEAKGSQYPEWKEELNKTRDTSKKGYEEIKALRADHDAAWETYKRENAEFRAYVQEERKRQQEEWAAERARRDAERAARAAENAPEPFYREITMADQLLKTLAKGPGGASSAAASKGPSVVKRQAPKVLDGNLKQFQKGKVKGSDAWMLGAAGKKASGKAPASKAAKPDAGAPSAAKPDAGAPSAAKPSGDRLILSLDTLEAFGVLGVTVPLTSADVPATVARVEAIKAEFLQKREDAKAAAASNGGVPPVATGNEGAEPGSSHEKPRSKPAQQAAVNKSALANLRDEQHWPSMTPGVPMPAVQPSENVKLDLAVSHDDAVAVTISATA